MNPSQPAIPTRALLPFVGIAFGLAWGLFVVLVSFPDAITGLFGPLSARNPLFILAVYAPAIAALMLIVYHAGPRALAPFFMRLTLWRIPAIWLAVLAIGIPAVSVLGAAWTGAPLIAPLRYVMSTPSLLRRVCASRRT